MRAFVVLALLLTLLSLVEAQRVFSMMDDKVKEDESYIPSFNYAGTRFFNRHFRRHWKR